MVSGRRKRGFFTEYTVLVIIGLFYNSFQKRAKNEIRRGLSLPHKGDTIPFDDRVSVCTGELEEVGGHKGIVIYLQNILGDMTFVDISGDVLLTNPISIHPIIELKRFDTTLAIPHVYCVDRSVSFQGGGFKVKPQLLL
jgi:hypothetical protein